MRIGTSVLSKENRLVLDRVSVSRSLPCVRAKVKGTKFHEYGGPIININAKMTSLTAGKQSVLIDIDFGLDTCTAFGQFDLVRQAFFGQINLNMAPAQEHLKAVIQILQLCRGNGVDSFEDGTDGLELRYFPVNDKKLAEAIVPRGEDRVRIHTALTELIRELNRIAQRAKTS